MTTTKYWIGNPDNIGDAALQQVKNVQSLPFIYPHIAIMPDVHAGYGCTVGSVIPTFKAIIPSCIGVDIGCGMIAVQTSLKAASMPDNLHNLRCDIEKVVPVGVNIRDNISPCESRVSRYSDTVMGKYSIDYTQKHQKQLGTLGGGNHFIELCTDECQNIWIMLHSGSRGIGNVIGTRFIELAKLDMERYFINLPDKDLAYLPEGSEHFDAYIECMQWAQHWAAMNRYVMLQEVKAVLGKYFPDIIYHEEAINCHHNYTEIENHYGKNVWVSRKGAVRARKGDLGIIPGSMGTKSYIVRGKGNEESLNSCSHGAGRVMSRSQARKTLTVEDHVKATEGVECRKDLSVIDESPAAYKDIDAVMDNQKDLVEIIHTLKQILCIKG